MFSTNPQGTYQPPVPHHHLQQSEIQSTYDQDIINSPRQTRIRRQETDMIGLPIHFQTGQFADQTIRAELDEVQKADLGRKYARVDRRPLDPPPVVRLRLFHIREEDIDQERGAEIKNYDDVETIGLVSTVDLFPIPPSFYASNKTWTSSSPTQPSFPSSSSTPLNGNFTFASPGASTPAGSQLQPSTSASSSFEDVVHYVGDYPIAESSKLTSSLVGATFVQPSIVDYEGKKTMLFVFPDLAVKIEGTFLLRYRVFELSSSPRDRENSPIQAECYGGPFRVYSTKEFPGLQASTELTKHLARWGVRLNIRETERKRRKKGELGSPMVDPKFKRKRPSLGSEDEEVSDED